MDAYMYQAALYCEDCGLAIRRRLDAEGKRPAKVSNESSFDSDDYPKGPYANGGGESDSPSHCDSCNVHLENSLTSDGEQYVRETVTRGGSTVRVWKEFYSYLFD